MTECKHFYCPHLHYKKCSKERHRSISYGIFPNGSIDCSSNAHIKSVNPRVMNIDTKAFDLYYKGVISASDTNFVKNFYLQNAAGKTTLINTVVPDYDAFLQPNNAINLATAATIDYNVFANNKVNYIKNARLRARQNNKTYVQNKNNNLKAQLQKNVKWIVDFIRKIEKLVEHIGGFNKQNIDPNLKQKLFLNQKKNINGTLLAGMKITDPNQAIQILEAIRVLLLRKKGQFEEERLNQEHQKITETSLSAISQDLSNASGISAVSEITNMNEKSPLQINEKYCDFQSLKCKWGVVKIQQVKKILSRLLTNKIVIEGEGKIARTKIIRPKNKQIKCNSNNKNKNRYKQKNIAKQQIIDTLKLDQQTKKTKNQLIKGGFYDTVGQKYIRNRKQL